MHFPRVPDALTTSIANSAVLAALCVAVAGCGGAVDQQPPINGNVYLGAVSGAQVAAYAVDADGHIAATPLATTVTDADGHFVLPGTLRWPLLVKSTGGSYTEEATGATSAPGETSLSAVYLSAPSTMVLSPYSSAIVADALAAGALTASNVAAASTRVSAFLGGVDPQQTVPAFVAVGAILNTIADGNRMAFALGAESQSRTDNGASVATSVQNIVAQSAKGDTLAACHSGAGDVTADGTVSAPADDTCDVSAGALGFSTNPLNRSGVTALAMLGTTQAAGPQTASAEANACGDRVALLEQNRSLFEGRKNSVQASLLPGMTAANWSTYPTTSTWGPHAAIYGTISAPSTCHDQDTFRRELVMAIENYWVDQNLNYCHHHIPGWTPPENTGENQLPRIAARPDGRRPSRSERPETDLHRAARRRRLAKRADGFEANTARHHLGADVERRGLLEFHVLGLQLCGARDQSAVGRHRRAGVQHDVLGHGSADRRPARHQSRQSFVDGAIPVAGRPAVHHAEKDRRHGRFRCGLQARACDHLDRQAFQRPSGGSGSREVRPEPHRPAGLAPRRRLSRAARPGRQRGQSRPAGSRSVDDH
nr:hypothetical protein [Burkholderia ambifaria]